MYISKMALLKFQFTDLNKYISMYKEFIDKAQLMKLKKKKNMLINIQIPIM